eukprot:CAMPEP_0182538572 /NCGR_PEP_ID=MMETSP1323-20130603/23898_1 /TAXON_ID=236787 /ORGANISM="Florenciella parvula, Strain RCC1693" /LENGTH=68 /DNA_ID=CAMNT_0024749045 /DNA_START=17 /DNA_END=220 /DNA_ORIENTATION=-
MASRAPSALAQSRRCSCESSADCAASAPPTARRRPGGRSGILLGTLRAPSESPSTPSGANAAAFLLLL